MSTEFYNINAKDFYERTVSLDIKFIAPTKLNDEIIGTVTIEKKTKSFVFLSCKLKSKNKITALSIGTWKILS